MVLGQSVKILAIFYDLKSQSWAFSVNKGDSNYYLFSRTALLNNSH